MYAIVSEDVPQVVLTHAVILDEGRHHACQELELLDGEHWLLRVILGKAPEVGAEVRERSEDELAANSRLKSERAEHPFPRCSSLAGQAVVEAQQGELLRLGHVPSLPGVDAETTLTRWTRAGDRKWTSPLWSSAMTDVPPPPPDDRWQQLIRAFDPERNFRALADMMEQAASGSEQVLHSVTESTGDPGDESRAPLRDAFAEVERSFARLYDAAGRFIVERPLGTQTGGAAGGHAAAEIAVLDGVGTTVIEIPGADGSPHCSDLRRHDGASIANDAVTILRSSSFDGDEPTFVIRVDVPHEADPGTYHGQILVEGLPDLALALSVTVVGSGA